MKKIFFIGVFILSLFAGRVEGQCTIALSSAVGTDGQTVCINNPITDIAYSISGATGASVLGLPLGVSGNLVGNTITIAGTPSESGDFIYTVQLTGCVTITGNQDGKITVSDDNTITLSSGGGTNAQTVCINSPITNITYATTGANGATFAGLPAGVNGSWSGNVVTISGSPTSSAGSPYNYKVTLTGGCGTVSASGIITVTNSNTITLSSGGGTNIQTACINSPITNITYTTTGANGATFTGLPPGVNGSWSGNVVTISGSPTSSAGSPYNYNVTLTGGCGTVSASGIITVTNSNTITLSSGGGTNIQTACINSPITNITYTTTGANGATFTGLPPGVNGSWSGNVVTISGSPTSSAGSPYNYNVTLTGGCGTVSASGIITVTNSNTITLSSGGGTNAQTVCINSPITNITYTTTGANGATFSGLPAGVNGSWSGNVVTISGSPTSSAGSPYNYNVTLTGGCGTVSASGIITVTNSNTITLSSGGGTNIQTACINSPITNITYTTTGANGATFTGLPPGVTGSWSGNVVTISGSPTSSAGSPYNYNVTLTGGCGTGSATGIITVRNNSTITLSSGAGTNIQTVCINSPIANITYATTVATGASFTGLPAGVNGSWAANVVTISGTPTVAGTFTYTVNPTGGCGTASVTGSITSTQLPVATFSYSTSPYCSNESNPLPTFSGGGVAGTFSSTPGLVFVNPLTGQVNLTTSTPGTHTVTNTIAAAGGCGIVSANSQITITPVASATIFYTGSPWCSSAGLQTVTIIGTTGGTYSALPAGLTINAANGTINPATSTAGTYTVIYNIPAIGGCVSFATTTSVTISPTPTAPVVGPITQPTCSVPTGSVQLTGLPTTGTGTWTLTRTPGGTLTNGSGTSTTITGLATGSYTFTVTNSDGCISPSSLAVVINTQPSSPAAPAQTVDCSLGFGHATVTVTSPVGAGLQYSLDGGIYQSSVLFSSVANGSHYISVTNPAGCTTTGSLFAVSCGCINPPTLTLSSSTGSTCGITAVTVAGNTFGGTATSVTITENGAGTVVPVSATVSPFSFTYTPTVADGGKTVIITVTTNNPLGSPCSASVATYTLTVNSMPSAPSIGTITHLTCAVPTGSVILNGLPSPGTWTLVRNPGAVTSSGNGTSTTVTGLAAGTYNFTVTSAEGCISAASADAVINPAPSAPTPPVIGTITQPTCAISTGSVVLSGLPATGSWTLTRTPGGVTIAGTGTSITIASIPSGTYTYSVTNSTGCASSSSANVIINPQPTIPPAPTIGTITPPTCSLSTGGVDLTGLPSTGTWTVIRYPGTINTNGTGTSTTISGLTSGTYNFTVTTSDGCLSVPSLNVVIPAQPPTPPAPVIGAITQPTFAIPSGSVVLSGLPSAGSWTLTRYPDLSITTGSGTTKTISELEGGVYTFTVTNSIGCASPESAEVTISTPGVPILVITDPQPVCYPSTVDITSESITAGSTPGLTYTYWTDKDATIPYSTPSTAAAGIYFIKGTTVSGYFNIKAVTVTVDKKPVPFGGDDQTLYYETTTTLEGFLAINETGIWSVLTGKGIFDNETDPKTVVSDLAEGENFLLWTVKGRVCPAVSDTVVISVQNITLPTLITPNMDGRNDYFVVRGLTNLGKTRLVVFDRRGAEVYKNMDYDNSWNGIDYNKKDLPDDTYFYILKGENGKSISGYIVIRR